MTPYDKRELLRSAVESNWFRSFAQKQLGRRDSMFLLLARQAVLQYLRQRPTGLEEADLKVLVDELVILAPRHRKGPHVLAGRWLVSELGDTHDGEYEVVAR